MGVQTGHPRRTHPWLNDQSLCCRHEGRSLHGGKWLHRSRGGATVKIGTKWSDEEHVGVESKSLVGASHVSPGYHGALWESAQWMPEGLRTQTPVC